jgi:hypothetical protein
MESWNPAALLKHLWHLHLCFDGYQYPLSGLVKEIEEQVTSACRIKAHIYCEHSLHKYR